MVNINPNRPGSPSANPDPTQGDTANNNAIHEAKPPFSRSITMGGTTPVAQEKKGASDITGSSPIPFDASGSPQTTPPPVVVPRIRRRISPLDEETAAQQHDQEDSHKVPQSLASRKGLTSKSHDGLTLSTASTVVEDAHREPSVIHHVAHDGPSAPAGASSQDPLKTPTKSTGAASHDSFQLPVRQAKVNAVIAEESEESKKEASEQPQESSKLPEQTDKQPQEVSTTAGTTSHATTDPSGPADPSTPTDASAPSSPSDSATITTLQTELARLRAENTHLQTTLTTATAASAATSQRYTRLQARAQRLAHEARLSDRVAARVHTLGQRAHNRAEKLHALYAHAHAHHRAALAAGKTWKTRAEAAEQERGPLMERVVAAEREMGELRKWREEAQVEGEGLWERAEGLERENEELKAWEVGAREEARGVLARAEKAEGELRVERERARKYRRAYEDLKIANEEKKEEGQGQGRQGQGQNKHGQNQQSQGQQGGGSVAAIAERVVGRINNTLEEILQDTYGKDVVKEKMALAGRLEQDPVIFEPLELAMDDEEDMEEREKELGVFFKYAHLRAEFAKNAGMDATQEQFDRAMKMEARAREEVRRLGRPRTKSF